jgi:hypothetical protein
MGDGELRRRRRRHALIARPAPFVAALLTVALVGCGGGAATRSDDELTIRLEVRDGALRAPGEPCAGSVPFLYVHASAPYRLEDGDGATLAEGRLPEGRAVKAFREELGVPREPTHCRMTIAVDAPERREYRLVVAGREPLSFAAERRAAVVTIP